jgi:hypothetical protein
MKVEKLILAAILLSALGGGSLQAIKVTYSGPGLSEIKNNYEGDIKFVLQPKGLYYEVINLTNSEITSLTDLADSTQAIVGPVFIIRPAGGANDFVYCLYKGKKTKQGTTIPLSGIKSLLFKLTMTPYTYHGKFINYHHSCELTTE